MTTFNGLSSADAKAFCAKWLPAWTGNDPALLASFYTEDVVYLDAAVPQGLAGKPALLAYFTRLLAKYPDWVWTNEEAIPLEDGFLNLWQAVIPKPSGEVVCRGVCFVQMRDGLIYRNQVYFDRSALLGK